MTNKRGNYLQFNRRLARQVTRRNHYFPQPFLPPPHHGHLPQYVPHSHYGPPPTRPPPFFTRSPPPTPPPTRPPPFFPRSQPQTLPPIQEAGDWDHSCKDRDPSYLEKQRVEERRRLGRRKYRGRPRTREDYFEAKDEAREAEYERMRRKEREEEERKRREDFCLGALARGKKKMKEARKKWLAEERRRRLDEKMNRRKGAVTRLHRRKRPNSKAKGSPLKAGNKKGKQATRARYSSNRKTT